MSELPEMTKISRTTEENSSTRTFFLEKDIGAEPGQFVMAWIPGIGEKPFSVSYSGNETGITVYLKGKFTKRLFGMGEGEKIGIRGPYGRGFEKRDKACVIGGGCGVAPLGPLIERLDNPFVIMGAKTSEDLIFSRRFPGAGIATDDGSEGFHGFTTQLLERVLKKKKFDVVYTCGPEIMMKKVFEICEREGMECQASLERYMKCGFGVCGHCGIDGFMVCKDGPVFFSEEIRKMKSFGKTAKLKSGRKVSVSEYAGWRCE